MIAFILSILSLFLFSFTASVSIAGDIWQQLGIPQEQGTEKIRKTFLNNYFDTYGIKNAKELAAGNRAMVAKDLLTYTKQYMMSPAFKAEYEKVRKDARPAEPFPNTRTKEDIRKERISEAEKIIKKTEEMRKTMGPEMKQALDEAIKGQQELIKDYKDPNGFMVEGIYQEQLRRDQDERKHYEEASKFWEDNYPADHKSFIRSRLEKYLKIAGTVDFDAALTEKYHKNVFVNPVYESKKPDWKMIFRAGKPVYEVAKPFTEQWIKELQ